MEKHCIKVGFNLVRNNMGPLKTDGMGRMPYIRMREEKGQA